MISQPHHHAYLVWKKTEASSAGTPSCESALSHSKHTQCVWGGGGGGWGCTERACEHCSLTQGSQCQTLSSISLAYICISTLCKVSPISPLFFLV